jgi:hypothetical protein
VVVLFVPGTSFAASPQAPSSDEFATGYSSTGCTAAEPASASPTVIYRDEAPGGCQELLAADQPAELLMVLSWARLMAGFEVTINGRF